MDQMEQRITRTIDRRADELIALADRLYHQAERGYAEVETAKIAAEELRRMGLSPREELAVTGVKAVLGEQDGPTVSVIGELDGIQCPEHPCAVPETGMSHACGHHAQLVAMLGAGWALCDPQVAASLGGRVALFAVPAEEYLNADYRHYLAREKGVKYSGGKSELVRLGEFDDIDLALTTHVHMVNDPGVDLLLGNNSCSGFIGKTITLRGKAAHAAAAPHQGINALNAASLGMAALGMLRETFQEKDYVRVHPIMKKGGDTVNVVPQEAVLDMMVRAKTLDAIQEASQKVDRAFTGAAYAFGAQAEILDAQGYMPVIERPADRVMREAAALIEGVTVGEIQRGLQNAASTDLGDLTHLMPVLNFTFGGAQGALHSRDFAVTDPIRLIVAPAKLLALTAYRLLRDGAGEARSILDNFQAPFTKQQYIDYVEQMHK